MICKEKWKRALCIASAALVVTVLALPAGAAAAPKYPDLRPLPPSEIHLGTQFLNGENHYVVRLTSLMHNAGQGQLELHGRPHLITPDGTFDVDQWIYDDTAGLEIQPVGTFYFHQASGHNHFHFDDFARFELWTKRDYLRAQSRGFTSGAPLHKSGKISFCLQDSTRVDAPPTSLPLYRGLCGPHMQGISVGWADLYDWTLDGQWVDVGTRPLDDGDYVVRSIADPTNKLYESPGKADPARESEVANSSVTFITISGGQLVGTP